MSVSFFFACELAVDTVLGWCSWLLNRPRQSGPERAPEQPQA